MPLPKTKPIALPSFLRRSMKAYALKAEIRRLGCLLQRQGRSRHWHLYADRAQMRQIITFIQQSEEVSWQWLATLLHSLLAEWTESELMQVVRQQPNITVNELMAKTNCTLAQARQTIDAVEFENEK